MTEIADIQAVDTAHLDDVAQIEPDELTVRYIYLWDDEVDEREEELITTINDYRDEYIYCIGIVYDELLRELVPLSSSEVTNYAWALRLGYWDEVETVDDAKRILSEITVQFT